MWNRGRRVAEGNLSRWPSSCVSPTIPSFTLGTSYVLGLNGEQVSEIDVSGSSSSLAHTNVFAAGRLLASYSGNNTYIALNDWVGTKRAELAASGCYEAYYSNPYGDNLTTVSATCPADATEQHFTGKERDDESGNDYFGARYYASSMGRFLSPDWSAKVMPVPYAKLGDPQTLNLYAYVGNNPLSRTDPSGHYQTSCGSSDISKCDQNTQNAEKARQAALQSSDPKVVAAAKAYGAYGEKNGVFVGFQTKGKSNVTWALDSKGNKTGINVTINSTNLAGINSPDLMPGIKSGSLAYAVADFAHEGSHVEDQQALMQSNFNKALDITNRTSEHRAYAVEESEMQSFGYSLINPQTGTSLDLRNDEAIDRFLNSLPPNPRENLDDPISK